MTDFFHSLGQSIWAEFPVFVAFLILFGLLICATLVARQRKRKLLQLERRCKELQVQPHCHFPQEESKCILQHQERPDKTNQVQDNH